MKEIEDKKWAMNKGNDSYEPLESLDNTKKNIIKIN
jgi:hypothetical protein